MRQIIPDVDEETARRVLRETNGNVDEAVLLALGAASGSSVAGGSGVGGASVAGSEVVEVLPGGEEQLLSTQAGEGAGEGESEAVDSELAELDRRQAKLDRRQAELDAEEMAEAETTGQIFNIMEISGVDEETARRVLCCKRPSRPETTLAR